jgi:uncharacterized protein
LEQELRTIYEAQQLDSQISESVQKMATIPIQIAAMDEKIKALKDKVVQEKEIIEEFEKERKKKEKEVDFEKDKIKKLESRLYEVKTNKEYQALLREIEGAKHANEKEEEGILNIMERIEELRKDYELTSKELAHREKMGDRDRRILQDELGTIDKTLQELRQARENLLSVASDQLRGMYSTLIERRNGLAVVNVKNGVCLGCFMKIPPQLFIEATKNKRLILCPSCNRIFYFREEDR